MEGGEGRGGREGEERGERREGGVRRKREGKGERGGERREGSEEPLSCTYKRVNRDLGKPKYALFHNN